MSNLKISSKATRLLHNLCEQPDTQKDAGPYNRLYEYIHELEMLAYGGIPTDLESELLSRCIPPR
jgi:hypothetical protein